MALTEMLTKIEDLATTTEIKGKDKLTELAKKELEQEEELKDTLKELQEVAKEIELVASTDGKSNTETIEKMAKALQAASEKIRGVEESISKETKKKEEVEAASANLILEDDSKEDSEDAAAAKEDSVKEGRKGKALVEEEAETTEEKPEEEVKIEPSGARPAAEPRLCQRHL